MTTGGSDQMPLLPENARRETITAAVEAHDSAQEENVLVPWKDESVLCPVVKVPLDAGVLNPHSHRIRAELESDERADEIRENPHSEESQARLAQILRETERYGDLKANLAEEGQRDHGVMTDAGLLVNANTRAVALRDLDDGSYIKVAVLPGDATEREIAELEVRLQMQRDFKQDYTFTNELLFIEDLRTNYSYSTERVAKVLRRSEKEVEQFTRLLARIRDIQHRSGGKIPLKFFNDEAVSLQEIDQAYERTKERDAAGARRIRETRILGLLVGIQYRDLRAADENFAEDHLVSALNEREEVGEAAAALLTEGTGDDAGDDLPGVDELDDSDGSGGDGGIDASGLVDVLAKSFGEENVNLANGEEDGEQQAEREAVVQTVAEAYSDAVAEAKTDERREKGLSGPINLLKDARNKLRRAKPAYIKVARDPAFKSGDFDYQLNKLKSEVGALLAEAEKQKRNGN